MPENTARKEAIAAAIVKRNARLEHDREHALCRETERASTVGKPTTAEQYARWLRCETCLHREYCPDAFTAAADSRVEEYEYDLERVIALINAGRAAMRGGKRRRPIAD